MVDMRNAYKLLIGKAPEGRAPVGGETGQKLEASVGFSWLNYVKMLTNLRLPHRARNSASKVS